MLAAGDLKLVEKPQPLLLAPHDFCNIKANIKVASTENGIIFGNIGRKANIPMFPVKREGECSCIIISTSQHHTSCL